MDDFGPSLLFCPADRPDRFGRALEHSKHVILDLEDAVAPSNRPQARQLLKEALGTEESPGWLDADRVIVRISSLAVEDGVADLELVRNTRCRVVLLSKAETVAHMAAALPLSVVALIETLRGLDAADDLAAQGNCVGLMWGGDDFTADIGGRSSRDVDGALLPHAALLRTRTLLAARRSQKAALDGPLLRIPDLIRLRSEATEAALMGFSGKAAVHPSQVPVIREAFAPSSGDVDFARRVLAAAATSQGGVTTVDGVMVDGPIIRHAQAVLDASG